MVLLLVVTTPAEPVVWMPRKPPAVVALVPDASIEPRVLFWMETVLAVVATIPTAWPPVTVVAV